MPIFEYQCQECGHVFEVLTRGAAGSHTATCPKCGKRDVERLLSPFTGRTSSGTGCASGPSGTG
jgi:putative FmdB family regulatory protein